MFADPDADLPSATEREILASLREVDAERTAPLDALKLLDQWKRKLDGDA